MTITGDDTTRFEGAPEVVLDIRLREIVANSLLHLKDKSEYLLSSETVKRPSQAL